MEKTKKPEAQQTICWYCQRAAGYDGGCNWSNYCIGKCETPEVENWTAERKVAERSTLPLSHMDGGLTFIVHDCPEFVSDEISAFIMDGCYDNPYTVKMHMEVIDDSLKYIITTIDYRTEEILDTFVMDTELTAQKRFDLLCIRNFSKSIEEE